MNQPPGFSTRQTSANTVGLSGMCTRESFVNTTSNLALSNGSGPSVTTRRSIRWPNPAAAMRSVPRATSSGPPGDTKPSPHTICSNVCIPSSYSPTSGGLSILMVIARKPSGRLTKLRMVSVRIRRRSAPAAWGKEWSFADRRLQHQLDVLQFALGVDLDHKFIRPFGIAGPAQVRDRDVALGGGRPGGCGDVADFPIPVVIDQGMFGRYITLDVEAHQRPAGAVAVFF